MVSRIIFGLLAAAFVSGAATGAFAQDWRAREAELLGLHDLCNRGDRKACVHFGILLGEARERHTEWRRTHPEFWWWER